MDDLVKRARLAQRDERMSTGALYGELADRIEELEAKLAKAVEALERYGGVMPVAFTPIEDGGYKARKTLAELKGGKGD